MSFNPILCFIIIISGIQSSPVSLIVQDRIIVFGSTIHLLCTLDDSINLTNGRSRQWSGGSENKVLSFNGFPSDPNKYKENAISTRQFLLQIFNTSEADVNCYYKCVYGFKFDEKMLDLNTMEYRYIPAADEINSEINYSQEGKHISASLTFQNIYPLPECMLSIGGSKLNMFVSRKAPHGLFYQLSMSINYTWEDNSCGKETKIECFIGERRLSIWKTQPEQCLEIPREKTTTYGETQNSKEACELVVLPVVTVGEWEQKEKPMEKIGLCVTKPLKGTNGIHNGHTERLENCKLL